jgi:cytochrome bd-type quinol oxidase subunit 2
LFCVAVLIYISQGIYFIFRNKVRSGDNVEQWRRLYGDVIVAVALILGFSFIIIFSDGKIRERASWDLALSLIGVVLPAIFTLPSLLPKRSKRVSSVKA